ncbi:low molecular weight phosphotyrosine protein phosphatase [Jejubacter calystegiae]|uniref:protein-tyrosine-phosphatase n=1 Tax=Jejubacter calystegiae TaxID=2579935 RepID=A0A4P8YHD2_9ENTR|nr:low molecular weight protein-tyrosine-phosphatase [Jejubacter calystegiae]QCT20089.1 low molecular weight phosphotyrosine protein phosphatase [Jejubacter calystegiae]
MGGITLRHILVVCTGNICRSPAAAGLLAAQLEGNVASAGIHALSGHRADARAMRLAERRGVSLYGHQARQLTRQMCRHSDLILAMERGHIGYIANMAPEALGKTLLLGHWLDSPEIADPWQESDARFEQIFSHIERAVGRWVSVLNASYQHQGQR